MSAENGFQGTSGRIQEGGQVPSDAELIDAVKTDDLATVRRLLDSGADPNVASWGQYNCLSMAILKRNFPLVELLLDHGADPNTLDVSDVYLCTPLDAALYALENAQEKIQNMEGSRSEAQLNWNRSMEVLTFLLRKGANPNREVEKGGRTAFHWRELSSNVLSWLLEHGADLSLR